jgi:hypothetical protein
MKRKLSLINLNHEEEMFHDVMDKVCAGLGQDSLCVGRTGCACGCVYEGEGGSSTAENACANDSSGLHSSGYSYSNCGSQITNSIRCRYS